jgi:hypothetical protein
MASGTRAPDLIVLSALIPVNRISSVTLVEEKEMNTERGLVLDIIAEQISRTNCGELGKSLKEPFCLCALSNAGCADQDNARCF